LLLIDEMLHERLTAFEELTLLNIFTGKPDISIDDASSSGNNMLREGRSLRLKCDVEFSSELKTNVTWNASTVNKNLARNKSSLNFVLTRNHSGNFTCRTNDVFGIFEKTIVIDVQCKHLTFQLILYIYAFLFPNFFSSFSVIKEKYFYERTFSFAMHQTDFRFSSAFVVREP